MDRNNILLILTDQHLYDALGCMGNPVLKTPNIDRIAAEGIIFDNAYCPAPICGPARSAIFTGRYPHGNGEVHNYIPLKAGTVLFTDLLTHQGYSNALVGKLHLSPCVKSFGFHYKKAHDSPHALYEPHEPLQSHYMHFLAEQKYGGDLDAAIRDAEKSEKQPVKDYDFWMGYQWLEEEYHDTKWTADESIRFLAQHDKTRPFFLNMSFFGPHHPYIPPAPWDQLYSPDLVELPASYNAEMTDCPFFAMRKPAAAGNKENWGEDGFKRLIAAYYGNIAMIDHYIGAVFNRMKKLDLWENTTVIFTADHGDHMGNYGLTGKGDMYEPSARIPLLIKPAVSTDANKHIPEVVNSIDLFATIAELAGFEHWQEYGDESRSLQPLIEGESPNWENETFSIIGANLDQNSLSMYRKDNFKLIRHNNATHGPVYELFDLDQNEFEKENLYPETPYRDIADTLTQKIEAWNNLQKSRFLSDS